MPSPIKSHEHPDQVPLLRIADEPAGEQRQTKRFRDRRRANAEATDEAHGEREEHVSEREEHVSKREEPVSELTGSHGAMTPNLLSDQIVGVSSTTSLCGSTTNFQPSLGSRNRTRVG